MSAPDQCFIDTNVVVYAYDRHEPHKRETARQILRRGIKDENIVLSPQVLSEFFVVVTKKIKEPLAPAQALEIIQTLSVVPAVDMDCLLVERGIAIHMQHSISYWDALILAAAERARCNILLTEDLKAGEVYNKVTVHNPFR